MSTKLTFDHVEAEAPNISTFYFRPEKRFEYTAGQYVELTLKHANPDNRGETRRFTLSSSPTDELLSITNKFTDKDGSTFKDALGKLQSGDSLHISKPMGDFILPSQIQMPIIFVAGGIGITPYRSMVSWMRAMGERRPVDLFYGARNETELLSKTIFEGIIDEIAIMLSSPSADWKGDRGYLTAKHIISSKKMSPETRIYLSGPEGMVASIQKELISAGVPANQLVLDLFVGYDVA
ncbi:MAG: FAD-dependent oxidoreductase [Candidatus Saccharimonadales bacterium]